MGEWCGHIGKFTLKECVWSEYKIQLEQFLEYIALKLNGWSDENKAQFVLSAISKECYNLLSDVCVPENLSYASLIEICDAHFQPRDNVLHARYEFYNAHKEPNQSPFGWAQCVQNLAVDCAFKDDLNATLRDRFITGLSEGPLLDRLFEEQHDGLSFEGAVQIAVEYDEMGNKKKNAKKREKQNARDQKASTNLIPNKNDNLAASVSATLTDGWRTMRKNDSKVRTLVEPTTEDLPDVPKNDVEVKEKSGNKHERKMRSNRLFSTETSDSFDRRSERVPTPSTETAQVQTMERPMASQEVKEKSGNNHERKTRSNHSHSTGTSDSIDRRSESVPTPPMETSQVEMGECSMASQGDCSRDDNTLIEDKEFFERDSCFSDKATEEKHLKHEQAKGAGNINPVPVSTKDESTEDINSNRAGIKSYAQTTGDKSMKHPDYNKDENRREITDDSSTDLRGSSSSSHSSQSKRSLSRDGEHDTSDPWAQKPNYKSKSKSDNRGHESDSSKNEDSPKLEPFATKNSSVNFIKVEEIEGDLFSMSLEYSLGHCVAEDMNMGSGIAVGFRQTFKRIDELLDQRAKQGGLAVLDDKGRFIYYLVTKTASSGKPTYETLEKSLHKMKDHIVKNNVKKLALPRLGCGLDRLEWSTVKVMLERMFSTVDIKITICNFQQNYGKTKQKLLQKKEPLPKNNFNKEKKNKCNKGKKNKR